MLSYILGTFKFMVNLYVSTVVYAVAVNTDMAAASSMVIAFFMMHLVVVCVWFALSDINIYQFFLKIPM